MKLDAVVLAGGRMTPEDPLFDEAPDGYRSLIDLQGKPMVQWVIDALSASDAMNTLYVIGLPKDYGLKATKPLHFLPDAGGMFENIHAGALQAAKDHPLQDKVMVSSGDIPALRSEMADWLVKQVQKDPELFLYYSVISQSVMEERFPESARSFVHFKDISVCGGDLNVIDTRLFTIERPIWKRLTEARKRPLKQASLLGLDVLALVALRLITLDGAVKKVCKKLSLEGRALVSPYAEMAMDADKPHQLAILRHDLEGGL